MAKYRQVIFRETGSHAYGNAQRVAFALRTLGFDADAGTPISSPAGSWANTIYVMTNAPLAIIRKTAAAHSLRV